MSDDLTGFDDYPDSGQNEFGKVVVNEEDTQTLYPEGTDCYKCHRESTGVVIVELPNQTEHKPICEEHLAEMEEMHGDVEFRTYE